MCYDGAGGAADATVERRDRSLMPSRSDRFQHPIFARLYAWGAPMAEAHGAADHRRELSAGLSGRVVELGAGTGLNFAYYPPAVTEVVAVEPEDHLRGRAREAAARAPVPVRVMPGVADAIPLEAGSCDAAVASLVLCSVPNQDAALAELFRVLCSNGELRFYEHVKADDRLASLQRAVDLVWPSVAGGCHTARDTVVAIRSAGFTVDTYKRFDFRPCALAAPTAPHVLGTARRPPR